MKTFVPIWSLTSPPFPLLLLTYLFVLPLFPQLVSAYYLSSPRTSPPLFSSCFSNSTSSSSSSSSSFSCRYLPPHIVLQRLANLYFFPGEQNFRVTHTPRPPYIAFCRLIILCLFVSRQLSPSLILAFGIVWIFCQELLFQATR